MNVKLKRTGSHGSPWMLLRQKDGAWQRLEQCGDLDILIPSGVAWCEADLNDGRWTVRRIIAAALPPPAWRAVAVADRPKRAFKIVASA